MEKELNHDGTTDPLLDIQVKLLFEYVFKCLKFSFDNKSKKFILERKFKLSLISDL